MLVGWATLMILARRNEKKVRADWLQLLSRDKRRWLADAHTCVMTDASLITATVDCATAIREIDEQKAMVCLAEGYEIIAKFTPTLLSMLSQMAKFSRMVSAMIPVTPLVPSDFRLAELANLAVLNQMLHHVIVSTRQRFRLKIYILGKGVTIVSRSLLERIRSIIGRKSLVEQEWNEIVDIEKDFKKLSEESAESFQGLLQALPNDAARQLAENLGLASRTKSLPSG